MFDPGSSTNSLEFWGRYEHPNGDIYFVNHELRLVTDADIYDEDTRVDVLELRESYLEEISSNPLFPHLPGDWELTLTSVTGETADVGIVSRAAGMAYEDEGNGGANFTPGPGEFESLTDFKGLKLLTEQERFWSHIAEHPSHHPHLPPGVELVFIKALLDAKEGLAAGARYPLTGLQIDQTIHIYQQFKAAQSQGANMVPSLGWLMGAVMPLDPLPASGIDGGGGDELEAIMAKLQF